MVIFNVFLVLLKTCLKIKFKYNIKNNNNFEIMSTAIKQYKLDDSHIEAVEPDQWEIQAIRKHEKEVKNGSAEYFDADEVFRELWLIK